MTIASWAFIHIVVLLGSAVIAAEVRAQDSAREKCCKQMNGRWEANRQTGEMRCFGNVGADAYYRCVAAGGLSKKK